jgi:hypothetical protein
LPWIILFMMSRPGHITYLSASSCPDYAVHQCARVSTNSQHCHELVVKWIVCYLKGTSTQGFFFRLAPECNVDCYVDTDFTGRIGH